MKLTDEEERTKNFIEEIYVLGEKYGLTLRSSYFESSFMHDIGNQDDLNTLYHACGEGQFYYRMQKDKNEK